MEGVIGKGKFIPRSAESRGLETFNMLPEESIPGERTILILIVLFETSITGKMEEGRLWTISEDALGSNVPFVVYITTAEEIFFREITEDFTEEL